MFLRQLFSKIGSADASEDAAHAMNREANERRALELQYRRDEEAFNAYVMHSVLGQVVFECLHGGAAEETTSAIAEADSPTASSSTPTMEDALYSYYSPFLSEPSRAQLGVMLREDENTTRFSWPTTRSPEVLPVYAIRQLMRRWGSALQGSAWHDMQSYLVMVLPAVVALVEARPYEHGMALVANGLLRNARLSLHALMAQTSQYDLSEPKDTHRLIVQQLLVLLNILLRIYTPGTSSEAVVRVERPSSCVTKLNNQMLFSGNPRLFLDSLTTSSTTQYSPSSLSRMEDDALTAEMLPLFLYFAKAQLTRGPQSGEGWELPTAAQGVHDSMRLFLYGSFCASPAVSTFSADSIVAAFSVLLLRCMAAFEGGSLESALALLQQLSSTLLAVAHLVRTRPVELAEALMASNVSLSLSSVLFYVGCSYCRAEGSSTFANDVRFTRDEVRRLALQKTEDQPANSPVEYLSKHGVTFDHVCDVEAVDEFLHCVIGVAFAVRAHHGELMSHGGAYEALLAMEGSILGSLSAPSLSTSASRLGEAPTHTVQAGSCLFDVVMKYVQQMLFSGPAATHSIEYRHREALLGKFYTLAGQHLPFIMEDSRLVYTLLRIMIVALGDTSSALNREGSSDHQQWRQELVATIGWMDAVMQLDRPQLSEEAMQHGIGAFFAVLVAALRSPKGALAHESFCENRDLFTGLCSTIVHLCSVLLPRERPLSEGFSVVRDTRSINTTYPALTWSKQLLVEVVHFSHQSFVHVLTHYVEPVFFLVETPTSCWIGGELLTLLLSYQSADTNEYKNHMGVLVQRLWSSLFSCVDEVLDKDEVLLVLLRCMRQALASLTPSRHRGCLGPSRALQNFLCGGVPGSGDGYLRLLHRATLPWRSNVSASDSVTEMINTLTALVRGNPLQRAALLRMVQPEELVECLRLAWLSAAPGEWEAFVRVILSFVYEEVDATSTSVAHRNAHNTAVLTPLLQSFAKIVATEFKPCHASALLFLMRDITATARNNHTDRFLLASTGLLEALTALLQCDWMRCTPSLVEPFQDVMITLASCHVPPRVAKQLLLAIAHTSGPHVQQLVPIVMEVILKTSQNVLRPAPKVEPTSYIAVRPQSGSTGVVASLHEGPAEGYCVAFWVRPEEHQHGQATLYSLQNGQRKTVLALYLADDHSMKVAIRTPSTSSNGPTTPASGAGEVDLGHQLPTREWVHVAVTHSTNSQIFFGQTTVFELFINGRSVVRDTGIPYPSLSQGYLFLGAAGEDVLGHLTRGFHGLFAEVYFFDHVLSSTKVGAIYADAAQRRADSVGSLSASGQFGSFVRDASIHIDPRLSEAGQLYNLSAFLRGCPREAPLVMFEGTFVCNAQTVVDAVSVLGGMNTVLIPLTVLLLGVELPFSGVGVGSLDGLPGTTRRAVAEADLIRLMDLVAVMCRMDSVAEEMLTTGYFTILSSTLEQLGSSIGASLPQRFMHVCEAALSHSQALFEAAYAAFFLSVDLFHACPRSTQLVMIQLQYGVLITPPCKNHEKEEANMLACARHLDVERFTTSVLLHNLCATSSPSASAGDDDDVRQHLLQLFDAAISDPPTSPAATALMQLVGGLSAAETPVSPELLVDILGRTRRLIFSRSLVLCQILGRQGYAGTLLPLLHHTCPAVRHEALLQLLLLLCRSKRTQELMNPSVINSQDAVHVSGDVSLSWLADLLQVYEVNLPLYLTLRCGLVGDFGVERLPTQYAALPRQSLVSGFSPVWGLILSLMGHCDDEELIRLALDDSAALLTCAWAWKQLASLQGWYGLVAKLYMTVMTHTATAAKRSDAAEEEARLTYAPQRVSVGGEGTDHFSLHPGGADDRVYATCTTVLGLPLFMTLLHEAFGATELHLVVASLQQHRALRLLAGVLEDVTMRFHTKLMSAETDAFLGLGSSVALGNFTQFVYVVEDTLFYSLPAYDASVNVNASPLAVDYSPNFGRDRRGNTRVDYQEWEHVAVIVPSSQRSDWGYIQFARDSPYASGSGKLQLLREPDGVWAHASLAMKLAGVLAISPSMINTGGTSMGGKTKEILFQKSTVQFRRGGFLRIFTRLLRMSARFILSDTTLLENFIVVAQRFTKDVATEQGLLVRLLTSGDADGEHSACASTMVLFHSVHDLLVRRIHHQLSNPPTTENEDGGHVDAQLVSVLHSLFAMFLKPFSQSVRFEAEVHEEMERSPPPTLQWLTDQRTGVSSPERLMEFAAVASRADYTTFVSRCEVVVDKERNTEKALAVSAVKESLSMVQQLGRLVTGLRDARQVVLTNLARLSSSPNSDGQPENEAQLLASAYRAVDKEHSALRTSVWARFVECVKGTIWNLDDWQGRDGRAQIFSSLSMYEQQPLVRRRLLLRREGTRHVDVASSSHRISETDPETDEEEASKLRSTQLRRRGGESVLLEQNATNEGETQEPGSTLPGIASVDNVGYHEGSDRHAHPGGGEDGEGGAKATTLAMSCEIPYMMHCWSAVLTLSGTRVCVLVDVPNKAHNPTVAEDAKRFLIQPSNFTFSVHQIVEMAPGRRFRMKRHALELWLTEGRSWLFNFPDNIMMRYAARTLLFAASHNAAPSPSLRCGPCYVYQENPLREPRLLEGTRNWVEGRLTNLDYLLLLNQLASRSVNDLTQYPIVPWVVADFSSERLDLTNPATFRDLSKPIGACGSSHRQEVIQQRYTEMKNMGDVPSHYFTHYSSPAVVLYFLVRLEPFTTLQVLLQGGHFDHPDRMFHSVAACFRAVMTSTQDVRELIPELYYLPELCEHNNQVLFGSKQDGTPMAEVTLPPWAHGSPYEFIYGLRAALESDHVSRHLHHWIDLIFGYKQRGKEAIKALNVFNWYSYEDLDRSAGEVDEGVLLDSLDNIGQTPMQLFHQAHPARSMVKASVVDLSSPNACLKVQSIAPEASFFSLVLHVTLSSRNAVVLVSESGSARLLRLHPIDVPASPTSPLAPLAAGAMKALGLSDQSEHTLPPLVQGAIPNRSGSNGGPCTPGNVAVLWGPRDAAFVVLGGLYDFSIALRPLSEGSSSQRLRAHRGRVIRLQASRDSSYLVSGSEDTTFVVWRCDYTAPLTGFPTISVVPHFTIHGHEGTPTSVDVSTVLDMVATASADGQLMLHALGRGSFHRSLQHPQRYSIDRVLLTESSYLSTCLYVSEMDHVIHQCSLNGAPLRSFACPGRITAWTESRSQHILLACLPHTRSSNAINATRDGVADGDTPRAAVPKIQGATVMFLHSFHLQLTTQMPLRESSTAVCSVACHPVNPHVMLVTHIEGTMELVQIEANSHS